MGLPLSYLYSFILTHHSYLQCCDYYLNHFVYGVRILILSYNPTIRYYHSHSTSSIIVAIILLLVVVVVIVRASLPLSLTIVVRTIPIITILYITTDNENNTISNTIINNCIVV